MNGEEFLRRLRDSRLLTTEQLREVVACCAGVTSAQAISEALTAQGVLTRFQAAKLLADEGNRLVLGQYRLLDELGHGGMGHVYKAYHAVMGRTVALKVLSPALQQQAVAIGWFEREVRTLTQLQHPNIVLAYDANEVDGVQFLVMEYVEGQNLHAYVRRRGPLPVAQACEMMCQAAAALQYAHEKGLVHRDVKPANLLIPAATAELGGVPAEDSPASISDVEFRPRRPLVKIVDFGLARLHSGVAVDTIVLQSQSHFAGTPDFVSPEQCRDIHAADIRSDLYSLGCTFYFALTGRPPFPGRTVTEKLANHLMEPAPPVTRLRPDVPAGLEAVILRLMAKDPEERFQSPLALAKALRPWRPAPETALRQPAEDRSPKSLSDSLARLHAGAPGTAVRTQVTSGPPAVTNGSGREAPAEEPPAESPSAAQLPAAEQIDSVQEVCVPTDVAMRAAVEFALRRAKERQAARPLLDPKREVGNEDRASEDGAGAPATMMSGASLSFPNSTMIPNLEFGNESRSLRDGWRDWIDVVASICERRGRAGWDEPRYRRLYESLLDAFRRGADGAQPEREAHYRRLEELVRPWVTLESLERTEPELLESLLTQCRPESAHLVRPPAAWRLIDQLRICLAPALVVWLVVQAVAAGWRLWSAGDGRWNLPSVLASLRLDTAPGQICLVLPVIVLAAILLIRPR